MVMKKKDKKIGERFDLTLQWMEVSEALLPSRHAVTLVQVNSKRSDGLFHGKKSSRLLSPLHHSVLQ